MRLRPLARHMEGSRSQFSAGKHRTARARRVIHNPIRLSRFIDDDRTEISPSDLSSRQREGEDSLLGEFLEETITFQPSVDDFCDKYDLDITMCEKPKNRNKRKYREFEFNLICMVEQGQYYVQENENEQADVRNYEQLKRSGTNYSVLTNNPFQITVEVISGSPKLALSMGVIVAMALLVPSF